MALLARGIAAVAAGRSRLRACGTRCVSEWLQGRPPVLDVNAGTLAAFLYKEVQAYDIPTKDAIIASQEDLRFSYDSLAKEARAYGLGLLDGLGVKKGDKVAVYCSNEIDGLISQYAATLAGATVVSIDASVPASDLPRIVAEEGARVLVFSSRVGASDRVEAVKKAFAVEMEPFDNGSSFGYAPIASKRARGLKYIVQTGSEGQPGLVRFEDLPVRGYNGDYDHDDIAAAQFKATGSETAAVYYGAGAAADAPAVKTGAATHTDILATAKAAAGALGLGSTDVVTVTAPLSSHFGFAAGAVATSSAHAKFVVPSKVFDAGKALAAMTLQKSTVLVATLDQVTALAAAAAEDAAAPEGKRKYDLTALRGGLVLGASGATALAKASLKAVNAGKFPGAGAFA